MKLFAALAMWLMAMAMAAPQYAGYGGAYPSNGQYQSYSGGFGWLPGFFGGSGYHSGSFHTNVAGIHSGDGGGVSIESRSSPGGFNTNASGNGGVNVTGMSSSWSFFPGLNGQSNVIHTDFTTKPRSSLSNLGDNDTVSNISGLQQQQGQLQQQQQLLPINTVGGQSQQQQQQQLEQQQQLHQQQQQQLLPANMVGGVNGPSLPDPTKLNPNELAAAKESILAYRANAANLLRQAEQIEQLILKQK